MRGPLGPLHGDESIDGWWLAEVKILAAAGVDLPVASTPRALGQPVIVARQWSEVDMLAYRIRLRTGTKHPKLQNQKGLRKLLINTR